MKSRDKRKRNKKRRRIQQVTVSQDVQATTVFHMTQDITQIFFLPPREAVRSAYAQSLGDYNTWDYAKYDHLVEKIDRGYLCGEFFAISD